MFRLETHVLHVTTIDQVGAQVNTEPLQRPAIVVPGRPFTCTFGNGTETHNNKVATVIYRR